MDMRSMELAHDLKAPLQLICSCVQLLSAELSPNVRATQYLHLLEQGAAQLRGMLTTALGAQSGGEHGRQTTDVAALLHQTQVESSLLAQERGIALRFSSNVSEFRMRTDAEKLRRIVQNLISNALRFTPSGGHIRLALTVRGDAVDIIVEDDGCGIAPSMQERIFEPGVSSDSSGYGLSIVRRFAFQLGGSIHLASALGRGSRFTLHLPVR